ncbi:MAG TPA: iron-sulfur cluster insertion protein ErpA [Chloroflexi bacterium]|nr:iron-sulfur cluster insertion protein ErpA [Chloroflexota bacterium]
MSDTEHVTPRQDQAAITLTPAAIGKIKELIEAKELHDHGLRVFVSGGGCSGVQYGMAFESTPHESDHIVEVDGVKVIIDPISLTYLYGASIDFVDNLMGGGFSISNPNAVSSCGCGQLSRTDDAGSGGGAGGCGCH